ncbi:glutaredoxin [Gymnopus androsaceus JB14]|uniref:Glutaredoxin n=1 Tax=Gymnopus androsaceus JB14 TaxID=1447944 RepID=A0A6A4H9N0_9AGAR|nr:glutaredoxin [Gymnopus androsaceus JB14]
MFSRILSPVYRLFSTAPTSPSTTNLVDSAISENTVTVFSKSYCPYCNETKTLFSSKFPDVPVKVFEYVILLDYLDNGSEIQSYLAQKTGQRTVPNVFIKSRHIGGNDNIQAAFRSGKLSSFLDA